LLLKKVKGWFAILDVLYVKSMMEKKEDKNVFRRKPPLAKRSLKMATFGLSYYAVKGENVE
jgi:hypothetical protein